MSENKSPAEQESEFIIETPRRLSQSLLWKIQRQFFERKGAAAWGESIVPFYVTTNPFIANAYARVVSAFLRDWGAGANAHGDGAMPALDLHEPVYIVELGSGAGRFGFNFLKNFTLAPHRSLLKQVRIKYVMTDLAEKNIEFWNSHPGLQPFIASGHLDFALFDAENPQPLKLLHSGETLSRASTKNPLILLANYFFDSIPQDAFYIEKGQFYESCLKLTSSQPEPDLDDPELFRRVTLVYSRHPSSTDYYAVPEFNQLLEYYRTHLDGTALDFPIAALECIRFFREWSGDRLLLLTGDKGYDREEDLKERQEPGYAIHGSFSMMVNLHAIAQYFRNHGGHALQTSYRFSGLNILAFMSGNHPNDFAETQRAFYEAIERGGPDDFFNIGQAAEAHIESFTVPQLLAYLRMSGWDSHAFAKCFPPLLEQVGSAEDYLKREVHAVIPRIWEHYYHLGEENDVPFNLGMLLYKIDEIAEALEYFEHSLRLYGPAPSTLYNVALCYYRLKDKVRALEALDQSLGLNPEFELAQKLRKEILSESK